MAIAFVRQAVGTTTVTVTTPASGNVLLLSVGATTAPTSVSGVATTWTKLADEVTNQDCAIWAGVGPFSGTTITLTGATTPLCNASEWSGFGGTPTLVGAKSVDTAGAADANVSTTKAATVTDSSQLIIGVGSYSGNGNTLSTNSSLGTNLTGNTSGSNVMAASYFIATSTSTKTATWSYNGSGGAGAALVVLLSGTTTFTTSPSGAITSAGALGRQPQKKLAGSISSAGALALRTNPHFASGLADDTGRDWTTPYQDITITYTDTVTTGLGVGASATGHTISVNGTPYTPTYRSGDGTTSLVLRVPVLVHYGDVLLYSYSKATGNTQGVIGELQGVTDADVTNSLTLRVRFTYRDKTNALVVNTDCKAALFYWGAGGVYDPGPLGQFWSKSLMYDIVTTDANGLFDWEYYGSAGATAGDAFLLLVMHPDSAPTESFAWSVALV